MEATYYRELSEECALQHGWRGEEQDGEAACFMYREILKRDNEISNLKILNGLHEENVGGLSMGRGFDDRRADSTRDRTVVLSDARTGCRIVLGVRDLPWILRSDGPVHELA
jgi:hypothetical protein